MRKIFIALNFVKQKDQNKVVINSNHEAIEKTCKNIRKERGNFAKRSGN